MNDSAKSNKYIGIGIVVIFIFIIARVGRISLARDVEGMSPLAMMLLVGGILCALTFAACICIWVYRDSLSKGENGLLWALIVLATTPFIGLIVYLIYRKDEKVACVNCDHMVSKRANYCEKCGVNIDVKEEGTAMIKTKRSAALMIAGLVAAVLMIGCFATFTVMAFTSDDFIDKKIWNTGVISMNYEKKKGNEWTLDFKSASEGFRKHNVLEIDDPSQILYAEIECGEGELLLCIEQGEKEEIIDVSNMEGPLEFSLQGYRAGKVTVVLEIHGAKNAVSYVTIK